MSDLRDAISDLRMQIDKLGPPPLPITQIVDSTNVLRINEYLSARDSILSKMAQYYDEYIQELEALTSSMLGVQSDLLDVLKKQSSMIKETADSKSTAQQASKRRSKNTQVFN